MQMRVLCMNVTSLSKFSLSVFHFQSPNAPTLRLSLSLIWLAVREHTLNVSTWVRVLE